MNLNYSVILAFLDQLQDRFSTYHEGRSLAERITQVSKIEGIRAIETIFPSDLGDVSVDYYKSLLGDLVVSSVNVNIKSERKFHHGGLTSKDPGVRSEAINYLKTGMDWASELGSNLITVCPMADGHDYPFQQDYSQAWKWLVEGLGEAASYKPNIKLSVEYKQSEPRHHLMIPNAGIALFLCEQIGLQNLGVTVDIGHALYAGESPAEVISMIANADRLHLIHINDNYRNWDWDMIPGTVNYWDWLETLYVLDEVGYDGWLVSDVFPSRLDPIETFSVSFRMIKYANIMIERFDRDRLRDLIDSGEVLKIYEEFQMNMLSPNG